MQYENREQAGKALARKLEHYAGDPTVIVLALPQGGVPVGFLHCSMRRARRNMRGPDESGG